MPARRALLIGIDAYQRIKPLEGCVNDVGLMEKLLLENFGFPRENVRVLRNDEATREAILEAFDGFAASVGADDQVVIHYAGHGSQMTDREGDEPSGYDSTIMPVDSEGWQGDNRDITDDEIHLRLLEPIGAKTPFTTFIFDCCHSGTITRDDFGVAARSMPPDRRPVSELPPSPIPPERRMATRGSGPSGWLPLADRYVLISGCRDEELSYEYRPPEGDGKVTHGALTYFLGRELRQARPGITYRDVFERASAQVTAANDRQHPQMEGRADREIFGVRDIEPMRFVTITGRTGNTVTVDAGAALGMTTGSTWSVHPQGTKSADADAALGAIEVTAVRGLTSEARIVSESAADAIVAGSRAFETEHAYGELRLRVQLTVPEGHEADGAAFRKLLDASPLLEEVEAGDTASVRIYLVPPRASAGADDPVPQLGALDAPVWAGVKEDGQLTMPAKPLADGAAVIANLETLARYRQALALENPDPASRLRGKFQVVLLRQAADGSWVPAKPDAASGQVVYEDGETIAFRVIADADRDPERDPAFLNLLYFEATGAISPAWTPGAKEKIRPGITFDIGTRDGGFDLYVPTDRFPFTDEPGGGATSATEVLKLIVTGGPADFSFLEQEGMRGAVAERKDVSPLMSLFETAMQGSATRALRKRPVKQEDWTTVTVPIVLRRKQQGSLDPGGEPISLGVAVLVTPGLEGEVRAHAWNSDRATAAELPTDALGSALDGAGVDVRQTVEISAARVVGPATRSARGGDAMELRLEDPGPGYGQMVMSTDESGVVSWHFAAPAGPEPAGSRGGAAPGARTYLIPRAVPTDAPGTPDRTRGLIAGVGRKFLKELVFPLVDPVLGAVGESFAGKWESKHRPYRVRPFGPDDYTSGDAPSLDAEGWRRIGAGRALLFVHGTFSRANSAFGELPKDWLGELSGSYEGRVFALDHYTLSHDPRQNVKWFFEQLPEGVALDLDIVCHSRGGLVSRVLTEKLGELNVGSRDVRVGTIVFVGAPNAGTVLADADRMGDLIDTWTNLLNFIPDGGVSDVLSGIITVAKQLAVGAAGGLKGLQSMRPGGDFEKWLNTGPRLGDTRYFALTSNYTPGEPGLRDFAKNRLMDSIFKGPNDLVVPTDGVWAENGSGFFPITDHVEFSDADAVAHTDFFRHRATRDRIREWLGA